MSSPFRTPKPPRSKPPASASKVAQPAVKTPAPSASKENEQPKSETKKGSASASATAAARSPPQVGQSPASVANLGTPRDPSKGVSTAPSAAAGTDSPFKEWATGALDCLDHEIVSPGTSGSLMSPSFGGMPVKIESSPLPTSTQEDVMSMCKTTSLHPSMQESSSSAFPLNLSPAFKPIAQAGHAHDEVEVDFAAIANQEEIQHPGQRKLRLSLCEEFSFEMQQGKVIALGFNPPSHPPSTVRSKKVSAAIPITPATRPSVDSEGRATDSSDRKRICNCKKSKCLKLYCECFSAGELCGGCKCVDCANDGGHEEERLKAVETIKQRNQNAFAPKFVSECQEDQEDKGVHARGCRCKKSHCLKKYCECFQAGVKCSDKCKCEECKNRPDENESTPRERAEGVICQFPSSGSCSVSPHSGKRTNLGEGLSPLRNKKPRVLDFSVTSTPGVHRADDADEQGSPSQYSDEDTEPRRAELAGMPQFGSPSSVFLQIQA